jgi:hypothetical protein
MFVELLRAGIHPRPVEPPGGEFRSKKGHFCPVSAQNPTFFAPIFEQLLLITNELMPKCTKYRAQKFFRARNCAGSARLRRDDGVLMERSWDKYAPADGNYRQT